MGRADWLRGVMTSFEGGLLRYARRMCGERAPDVVQDTFVKLWEADPPPDPDVIRRWLYRVCRNRAIDVVRKEARVTLVSVVPDTPAEPAAPGQLEQQEAGRGVLRALDSLSDQQQEVVRLRFQEGLSYREIADVLGSTTGSVGVTLHKAMQKLRAEVTR